MKLNEDEKLIRDALKSIYTPEYNFSLEGQPEKHSFRLKKGFGAVLAVGLSVIFAAAVVAAVTSFGRLTDLIGTESAELLTPVQLTSEKEGIKVEVVAVARYDNMIRAYVTISDTEGKGRVTENVRFNDKYSLTSSGGVKTPFSSEFGDAQTYGCSIEIIDYDKETQTATLQIESTTNNGFLGDNLVFSISELFINQRDYSELITPVDYGAAEETISIPFYHYDPDYEGGHYISSWGGAASNEPDVILEKYAKDNTISFLKPMRINRPIPNSRYSVISNMGIVDGRWHIQVVRDLRDEEAEMTAMARFKAPDMETLNPSMVFSMFADEAMNPVKIDDFPFQYRIEESIFDLEPETLAQYQLYVHFETYDIVEGDWRVTFPSETYDGETIERECEMDLGYSVVSKITISPLSLVLTRTRVENQGVSRFPVVVLDTGEEMVEIRSYTSGGGDGTYVDMFVLETPVDINSIEAIIIDGVRLEL
ncbi:MAG: hypothetical protein LBS84_05560 [Clostridiales bacterium]|jgi:hypothetical protein|nr:hypothetical protein [Clostridiales bacterium]